MLPNLFPIFRDAPEITDIIGTSPVRFYRHGEAPQNVTAPYVTHLAVDVVPELILQGTPPIDSCRVQISCWSDNSGTGSSGIVTLATAVRDAIEQYHHVLVMRDMGRDFETQRYRIDLDVSVWLHRNNNATSSSSEAVSSSSSEEVISSSSSEDIVSSSSSEDVISSSSSEEIITFTLPSSDIFPVDLDHLRRALIGGTLSRSWVAFDQGATTYVLSFNHGGSFADPTIFVPSLSGATHAYVSLGATSRTATQVADAFVSAASGIGVSGISNIAGVVTVTGASNLVIPPNVDMTDTSLRGMFGAQRDDWGDGGPADLNGNGGTGGIGSIYVGRPGDDLGRGGRVIGAYLCGQGNMQPRLGVSSGPVYSASPGVMTLLGQGITTATMPTRANGGTWGASIFEAAAFAVDDDLWAHYRDNGSGGIRFRLHSATPSGPGDFGAGQVLVWDTTTNASSAVAFGATYTPTVNATFSIYTMIGLIFELPDADGNYPANGRINIRVGDHNDDINHGTQFDVPPAIISGETTHHRWNAFGMTNINVVSVTRAVADLAAGEDSRVALYQFYDLNFPSTTPANLVADIGRLNAVENSYNTLTLGTPVPIGTEVLGSNAILALGFNYATVSGAALTTYVLPVFLDGGGSSWLNCWVDDRATWHDDIRGASDRAPSAGVTEYRTRVVAGNTFMPTTDVDLPWPDPMATDASDDSPSAIALDWYIIERTGIT